MCGIAGIVGHSHVDERLERAVAVLHHRGPDGRGVYVAPKFPVGLGHTRLAVIGLETGQQPMSTDDGRLVLSANGEIYEFERIRRELQSKGHRFNTGSDSETILHLYRQYGHDFVHHLRGEFAFLLYDRSKQRFLAVRDRFGIKPLYYHQQGNRWVFGSEAKAIFATGVLKPRVDPVAVRNMMCSVSPRSFFQGIEAVPPGCMLDIDVVAGRGHLRRYWDLDLPSDEPLASDEHVELLQQEFEEAVKIRLRADVPIGVYLSGGIDSSGLVGTVARLHNRPLKAFTIRFPGEPSFNEYSRARRMAEFTDTDLYRVDCDRRTLLAHLEECLWVTEQPFSNLHGVSKFLLSALARKHVKVVLSGEGADEVFLGYNYFQPGSGSLTDQLRARKRQYRPPRGRHVDAIIERLGFLPLKEHADSCRKFTRWGLTRFFAQGHRQALAVSPIEELAAQIPREQILGRTTAKQLQYFSTRVILASYILSTLGDRQKMGYSVEGRTPFLDHRLFEAMRRVPDAQKINNGTEKHILREAMKDRVTREVYLRQKDLFAAPPYRMRPGACSITNDLFDAYGSDRAVRNGGLFDSRTLALARRVWRLPGIEPARLDRFNLLLMTTHMLQDLFQRQFSERLAAACTQPALPRLGSAGA